MQLVVIVLVQLLFCIPTTVARQDCSGEMDNESMQAKNNMWLPLLTCAISQLEINWNNGSSRDFMNSQHIEVSYIRLENCSIKPLPHDDKCSQLIINCSSMVRKSTIPQASIKTVTETINQTNTMTQIVSCTNNIAATIFICTAATEKLDDKYSCDNLKPSCPVSTIYVNFTSQIEYVRTCIRDSTITTRTLKNTTTTTLLMDSPNSSNCAATVLGGLGAFIAVQFLALLAVTIGWIYTCVHMKLKRSGKYTVTRNNTHFSNPLYNDQVSTTEPEDMMVSTQDSVSYEVLNTTSRNHVEDSHMYDVIPANRSKMAKKHSNFSVTQRDSVLTDTPCTPPPIPSRGSHHDTSQEPPFTPRPAGVVQSEGYPEEPKEHIYHILEPGAAKSSSSSPDTDTAYHLLEEGGVKGPGEHILGRVSWSGPESGGEGCVVSSDCSEEWEGRPRTPSSYEVPIKLLTARDEGNIYS